MTFHKQQFDDIAQFPDDVVFIASLKHPDYFEVIIDRYQQAFIRKAKSILKNDEDAYDAVQETFVRMYSAAKKYRKQENIAFKSWAYKILVHQCFTMYQKTKKEKSHTAFLGEDSAEMIPDMYELKFHERKLTKEYLLSLVSRLPLALSRVVTMHFIEEIPQKDIAQIEGVSHEVIRTRIYRAKKELRELGSTIT